MEDVLGVTLINQGCRKNVTSLSFVDAEALREFFTGSHILALETLWSSAVDQLDQLHQHLPSSNNVASRVGASVVITKSDIGGCTRAMENVL